jgi:hypothetical protein
MYSLRLFILYFSNYHAGLDLVIIFPLVFEHGYGILHLLNLLLSTVHGLCVEMQYVELPGLINLMDIHLAFDCGFETKKK